MYEREAVSERDKQTDCDRKKQTASDTERYIYTVTEIRESKIERERERQWLKKTTVCQKSSSLLDNL